MAAANVPPEIRTSLRSMNSNSVMLEFRDVVEMRVVLRQIEAVDLRTREDQQISQRHSDTKCPPSIGESNRSLPDRRGNLVVGQQLLVLAEGFSLGVIRDAAPEFKAYRRAPRGLTAG